MSYLKFRWLKKSSGHRERVIYAKQPRCGGAVFDVCRDDGAAVLALENHISLRERVEALEKELEDRSSATDGK